jgi:hypothetical protein
MNAEVDEKFLRYLLSKRKEIGPRRYRFSFLDITSGERKRLYEIGEQAGLLTPYEFSGIKSAGISRNDAARRVLALTRERAFTKLKVEFGAKAHFWVQPKQCFLYIDFYWRRANLGVVITGPLMDHLYRAGPERTRDHHVKSLSRSFELKGLTILTFPYYVVWHHPSEFIKKIRQKLIGSGHYSRLNAQSESK